MKACPAVDVGYSVAAAIQAGEIEADDYRAIFDLASGLTTLHLDISRTPQSIDLYSYAIGMAIMMAHSLVVIEALRKDL